VAAKTKNGEIIVMFGFGLGNQLVKNLRKDKGFTVAELADRLKIDSIEIKRVDQLKLKDVPEPLKSKLVPLFRGDDYNKIPW
jgi:hypothetical protein